MISKEFDCVEMKHRTAENVQKSLAGKPHKDQIAFWRKQQDLMLARRLTIQKSVKKAS